MEITNIYLEKFTMNISPILGIYESLTYIKQETVGFHIYLFSLAREEEEGQSEKTTQHHLRVLSLI